MQVDFLNGPNTAGSEKMAGQIVHSFVRSFVCSFVRSFVRSKFGPCAAEGKNTILSRIMSYVMACRS